MKFLADEDFPKPLVVVIRNLEFSVKTIQQKNLIGSSDQVVAAIALKEKRILLTFDKDFLKNKFENLKVIVFEFPKIPTQEIILLIEAFLNDLKKITFSRKKIYKFSKHGLEAL